MPVDKKETEERGIPDEFLMNSRVVFISSFTEIPEDLKDNILAVQLNYTTAQAHNMMDNRLEELLPEYPELTIEDKKDIVAFLKKHKRLSDITLRDFLHVAAIWMSEDPNREAWALEQIRAIHIETLRYKDRAWK